MKKIFKRGLRIILALGIAYLLILVGGFFGIKKGLTNTAGIVDEQSDAYREVEALEDVPQETPASSEQDALQEKESTERKNILREIEAIGEISPLNAEKIANTYLKTGSDGLVKKMIFAVKMRIPESERNLSCQSSQEESLENLIEKYKDSDGINIFPWMNDEEWFSIQKAVIKDKDVINRAAKEAQLPPRLIVSSLIVEQLRLFHSQRELFKKFFEPLKILGNSTKISLGVMGVKEATAIQVENNLKDRSSPYYLGSQFENKLNFATDDVSSERFSRLANEKDHYYSYLYGALYIKQMMTQWEKAGYDIRFRPEIIGTLFNVGFPQSKPNPDPKVGGSSISIGDAKYSFGSLAYEFYYSGVMEEEFPYVTK